MRTTNREPEIVTRNGKPVSVILPIKVYKELLERAEDAEDVAWLKRAGRKKLHYRPLEDTTSPKAAANSHVPRLPRTRCRERSQTIISKVT